MTSYVVEGGYGLQFCKTCGSTVCTTFNDDVFHLTLGCVNGAPDVEIGQHIYVGSKASWEVISEGVVQFEEEPK